MHDLSYDQARVTKQMLEKIDALYHPRSYRAGYKIPCEVMIAANRNPYSVANTGSPPPKREGEC